MARTRGSGTSRGGTLLIVGVKADPMVRAAGMAGAAGAEPGGGGVDDRVFVVIRNNYRPSRNT